MKELLGQAVNYSFIAGEKEELVSFAELIFVVTEPVFKADAAGEVVRQREAQTLRFGVTSGRLRGVIKALQSYAKDMDEMERRYELFPMPAEESGLTPIPDKGDGT